MPRFTIVIPCYNEANRLQQEPFRRFVDQVGDAHLLFVNDGSSDGTLALLQQMQAATRRCHVLDLPHNLGKAEAVRRGVVEGLRTQPDYIGYWDADLATPLEVALPFLRVLQQQAQRTLVMGSRVAMLGHRIQRPRSRMAASRAFSAAVSCTLGVAVYDSQCGAKLFRNVPFLESIFARPFRSRWIFDVEILARLRQHGQLGDMVYEFPLDEWRDVHGSKLRGKDFFKAACELLIIWRQYRRAPAKAVRLPAKRVNDAA